MSLVKKIKESFQKNKDILVGAGLLATTRTTDRLTTLAYYEKHGLKEFLAHEINPIVTTIFSSEFGVEYGKSILEILDLTAIVVITAFCYSSKKKGKPKNYFLYIPAVLGGLATINNLYAYFQ